MKEQSWSVLDQEKFLESALDDFCISVNEAKLKKIILSKEDKLYQLCRKPALYFPGSYGIYCIVAAHSNFYFFFHLEDCQQRY